MPPTPLLRFARFEVAATGAGWAPAPSTTRGAFGGEVGVLFDPAWRASLGFLAALPEERDVIVNDVTRGTLSVQHFDALLSAGRCIEREVRPCAALVGGVRFAHGSTSGDLIFHSAQSWQARPTFGLALQLAWVPWRWLYFAVDLLGLVNPVPAEFDVQGIPAATVSLPTLEGMLRVSIGASIPR